MKLEDISPMPFGKYKGILMQDVPVTYLHWLWHNVYHPSGGVYEYIKENISALKLENKDLLWDNR